MNEPPWEGRLVYVLIGNKGSNLSYEVLLIKVSGYTFSTKYVFV
jgi:hypothetical protein